MTDIDTRARYLAEQLTRIYGEELVSILLYGSAARGEYRQGVSDLNTLVILDTLDVTRLREGAPAIADWTASGNPPPLMMSRSEWLGSADVFPIEYTDIRDAHRVLAGIDPFDGIRVEREHLRLQLEHELRSKKIQLREGYLAFGASPVDLAALLVRSLPTFLALFRALLRLNGSPVPAATPELIRAVATVVGFDGDSMLEVSERRAAGAEFEAALAGDLAAGYLSTIERTVDWLDTFAPDPSRGDDV